MWKKEDELKQLKSELPRLTAKFQLELAPPTPEVAEKENDGQEVEAGFGRCTERAATAHRGIPADTQSGE